MEKEYAEYIPDIEVVKKIEGHFGSDFHTLDFDEKGDFETYLCALAYGCVGKELFYDAKIAYKLDRSAMKNPTFMQGMLTYSLITKINRAREILDSLDFKNSHEVDFSKFNAEGDYATVAFIMYYLNTKGYKVEWDKMCHAYTPLNMSNRIVSFKKDKKLDPQKLLESVENTLSHGTTC